MVALAKSPIAGGGGTVNNAFETQRHRCEFPRQSLGFNDRHIKLVKAHALRNGHRLRGKSYRIDIGCRDFRRKGRGRGSPELQSDPDGARGQEGFTFRLCKTGDTLVGIHGENVSTLVQTPSRRRRYARRDAQSDGGCTARSQRRDLKRGAVLARSERQIHRRLRA